MCRAESADARARYTSKISYKLLALDDNNNSNNNTTNENVIKHITSRLRSHTYTSVALTMYRLGRKIRSTSELLHTSYTRFDDPSRTPAAAHIVTRVYLHHSNVDSIFLIVLFFFFFDFHDNYHWFECGARSPYDVHFRQTSLCARLRVNA